MNQFSPQLTSNNGWLQLVFDLPLLHPNHSDESITNIFPTALTILELFHPWPAGVPDSYHLEKYIDRQSPQRNSVLVCKARSNIVVERLFSQYYDPSVQLIGHEESLRIFCDYAELSYEYVEYHEIVKYYFGRMFPGNLDCKKLRKPFSFLLGINKNPDAVGSVSEEIVCLYDRSKRYCNFLKSRFSEYRLADGFTSLIAEGIFATGGQQDMLSQMSQYTDTFTSEFNKVNRERRINTNENSSKDVGEVLRALYERIDKSLLSVESVAIDLDKSIREGKKSSGYTSSEDDDFDVCQCWFCCKFYERPKLRNNSSPRYCEHPNCTKRYKAWMKALERKGESIESIGL
jgi:hypothetical protein